MRRKEQRIPRKTLLEQGLPVEELYQLARREGNSKKPIYEIHKWWARRLGHVFRMLLIAGTTPRMDARRDSRSRELIRRFYSKNNFSGLTVLDPFMGGGTSAVEALKCGARIIGIDIDPVAWFISKKEIEPFSETEVRTAYSLLAQKVEAKVRALYQCREPQTGELVEIVNAFWVARFNCTGCQRIVDAHPHFRLMLNKRHRYQIVFCRHCEAVRNVPLKRKSFSCRQCARRTVISKGTATYGKLRCPHCKTERVIVDLIKKGKPARKHLFAIEYSAKNSTGDVVRRFKRADRFDGALFRKAETLLAANCEELPYPRATIFEHGRYDARPLTHGYARYEQLFNARQLYCLAVLFREILAIEDVKTREYLLLAFSDCLACNNELVSYAFGYQKATPLFAIHAYQVPQRPVEGNVWGNPHFGRGSFSRCVAKMIAGKKYAVAPFEYRYADNGDVERVVTGESIVSAVVSDPNDTAFNEKSRACLLNQSSIDLSGLKARSVDLILTDPPFYNNLPYSELSDFYFQWLRLYFKQHKGFSQELMTPVTQTFFVRRKTVDEHQRYLSGLTSAMKECSRILKPNGIMIFTFHHKEPAAWHALSAALRDTQFRITGIGPVRAEGVSGFHSYSGTPKWDAVICCRLQQRPEILRMGRSAKSSLTAIEKLEQKWSQRFRRGKMPWNESDKASFAFALGLREIVNGQLADQNARSLLRDISQRYPQLRVAASIPKTVA
jgi:putative DNA methylase